MPSTLLNPAQVSRLTSLQLRAQTVVEGFLTGLHQSPYHGFSVEFAQHRPYMPGDSLKHLDYKVLGKTGRYYIKQFEEETNLKAYLLVDHSASMGFGSGSIAGATDREREGTGLPSKLEYAECLSAAISLLLLKQRDAVGLVTFAEKVTSILPPKSTPGWLGTVTAQLQGLIPAGKTSISTALFDIAERVKRRGLVVLFSDLLGDPEETLSAMKAVRHIGHELIVFQVLDPLEVSFDFGRDAKFRDMESGEVLPTRPWHLKDSYREEMQRVLDFYKQGCSSARIDYSLCTTGTPYEVALYQFLSRRKRLV